MFHSYNTFFLYSLKFTKSIFPFLVQKNQHIAECWSQNPLADQVISTGHAKLKCFCKPKACHGDYLRTLILNKIKESQ